MIVNLDHKMNIRNGNNVVGDQEEYIDMSICPLIDYVSNNKLIYKFNT